MNASKISSHKRRPTPWRPWGDHPYVVTLGVVAAAFSIVVAIRSLEEARPDAIDVTNIAKFSGGVGHETGSGDEFSDFVLDHEGDIVFLDIQVESDELRVTSGFGGSRLFTFELANQPSYSMSIQIRVSADDDFYNGEGGNGTTTLRGYFKVLGNSGAGTGISETQLQGVPMSVTRKLPARGGARLRRYGDGLTRLAPNPACSRRRPVGA